MPLKNIVEGTIMVGLNIFAVGYPLLGLSLLIFPLPPILLGIFLAISPAAVFIYIGIYASIVDDPDDAPNAWRKKFEKYERK